MKITMEQPNAPQGGRKSGKKSLKLKNNQSVSKGRKTNDGSRGKEKEPKRAIVRVPTSRKDKLVDHGIMRHHNFMSVTTPMLTRIFHMTKIEGTRNEYMVDSEPHHVSAIMKLVLNTMQTNELSSDWSVILWNITQQNDILPEGCSVTFSRVFDRKDNAMAKKRISRRRKLAILSSSSEENVSRQSVAVSHDLSLLKAIDSGDSVVSFGAEAIVTAPDEPTLEIAIDAVKNYLAANDETRGLHYELDINKQMRPYITYGANEASGNGCVTMDMTSWDAAQSAMFVDSGGDRTLGSEYMGVSVGKLIRSHAAYNFINHQSLFIGNDTTGKTCTLCGDINEPSQIYLSKVASRAYMLTGHKVTHFVMDDPHAVQQLLDFPIKDSRKCVADVSKGLLNLLEIVDADGVETSDDRISGRFNTHLNNIITLLSQFRDKTHISISDDFANIARDILLDFYASNKYWGYNVESGKTDIRLIGVKHSQVKRLSDFGQYIAQRKRSNEDVALKSALDELNTIVNRNILPTVPALNTKTDPLIDRLVNARYRIVDLTGMSVGAVGSMVANPSMNVMMISYLNLLLPSMKNGDVIVLHGISRLSSIARIIRDMIAQSGLNLDVVYTEQNQNAALTMMSATSDIIEEDDEKTGKMHKVNKSNPIDFTVVDLYNNRSDKLVEPLGMNKEWVKTLSQNKSSFFIKTETGLDYIYLDKIL